MSSSPTSAKATQPTGHRFNKLNKRTDDTRSNRLRGKRRVAYRPTGAGWIVLALSVVALFVPRQLRDGADPRPLAGAVLLLTLLIEGSSLVVRRRRFRPTAVVETPPVLRVEEQGEIIVRTQPGLRVRYNSTFGVDESGIARVPVAARERGVFRSRAVSLEQSGPLGLVQRSSPVAADREFVCIGPKRFSLETDLLTQLQRASFDQELDRLRTYIPGDDVRNIHWRSTARSGEPIVQVKAGRQSDPLVVIDLGPSDGPKAEAWASVAASALEMLLRFGPIAVRSRDTQGETLRTLTTDRHIDVALGSAVTGEPVDLKDADVYIGTWRNDISGRPELVVLSDRSPVVQPMISASVVGAETVGVDSGATAAGSETSNKSAESSEQTEADRQVQSA